mgnify:FL=1|tara:strand:+ start:187 stop:876 length:690 start_codon:yes stop_codon:yes gene_type:complete
MIAIILSAGKSSRLISNKNNTPKTFRKLNNKVIINFQINKCLDNNFKKIYINILLKNKKYLNLIEKPYLKYLKIFTEKKPLGTLGGVLKMSEYLYQKDILIIYGDNITNCNYYKMMDQHIRCNSEFTIGYYLKKNPYYSGIIYTKKNKVVSFEEKKTKKNNEKFKVNAGIYIIKTKILKDIKKKKFFDFAKDLIPFLIKEKKKISLFKVNKIYTFDNQYLFNKNKKITI